MILEDICHLIVDCPHSTAEDEGEGYPLIRTPNIGMGYFILEGVHRVSEEVYNIRNRRAVPQDDDLILAREAPAGNVAIIKNGEKYCLGQRTVLIRPNKELVDPDFLTYYLLAPRQQHNMLKTENGSTASHVNMPIIRGLDISLPLSMAIQQKIGRILSQYDELIAINRKKIQVLEEMAMRTYREWFVYMRFPGYETTPKEDGLPQGWKYLSIGNMLSSYIGGGWGEEEPSEKFCKPAYVIRGTDIPSVLQGIPNYDIYRFHSKSNLKSRVLNSGDIIFEISGGSDSQPLGRNCLITNSLLQAYGGDVICASFCKRLVPKQEMSLFLYTYLQQIYRMGLLDTFCVRTTGISNFKFEAFIKFEKVLVPSNDILILYNKIVSPIYEEISKIGNKIGCVAKMRDKLLPQLMSGKLEIKA